MSAAENVRGKGRSLLVIKFEGASACMRGAVLIYQDCEIATGILHLCSVAHFSVKAGRICRTAAIGLCHVLRIFHIPLLRSRKGLARIHFVHHSFQIPGHLHIVDEINRDDQCQCHDKRRGHGTDDKFFSYLLKHLSSPACSLRRGQP